MPAYDDPSDDFDDLGPDDFGADAFPFDGPGLPHADAAWNGGAATPADSLGVLVRGETGVRFESLVLFADPLFSLYGLDPGAAFALRTEPEAADEATTALLETARMLWAFFTLAPDERARRRDALAARLLGPEPTEDDWHDLDELIASVEPYWNALEPDEIADAQQTGHPALAFDALLQHPAFALGEATDDGADGYGAEHLSELEARALFAQPFLDRTAADADAFEAAMERANEFWHLAQHPAAERADALAAHVMAHAPTPDDAPRVEAEARRMLARYDALFPEHTR